MVTSTALTTASDPTLPVSIDECYERAERVALFEVVEVSLLRIMFLNTGIMFLNIRIMFLNMRIM